MYEPNPTSTRGDGPQPARPLGPDVCVTRSGGELSLVHKDTMGGLGAVVGFLGTFTYCGISYVLLFVQEGPTEWNVGTVLGIFVWLLLGLMFPAIMIVGFFGEERARLGSAGLHSERWALISYRRRFVPRSELRGVCAATVTVERESGPVECPVLRFETSTEPLDFALGISEKEQAWLVALVRDFFLTLTSSDDGQDAANGPRQ